MVGLSPFYDTVTIKKKDCKVDIAVNVWCKQTHMNKYLHFRSLHQRGTVRCHYDCDKN